MATLKLPGEAEAAGNIDIRFRLDVGLSFDSIDEYLEIDGVIVCCGRFCDLTIDEVSADPNPVVLGGTATLTVSHGGRGLYSYAWTGPDALSSNTARNPQIPIASTSGTYTVVITDTASSSCTLSDSVYLAVRACTVTASAGQDPDPVCAGGSAQLDASGSTGSGALTYSWSPSGGLSATDVSAPTASPSSSTTYTVTVTSDGSCTDSDEVRVRVNENPTVTLSGETIFCEGDTTIITANPLGGSGIYSTYVWSGPGTGNTPTAGQFTADATGTVTVTVEDSNGCVGGSLPLAVTGCPNPPVDAGPDQAICSGESAVIGSDDVPVGNYRYSWTPAAGLDDPTLPNPTVATGASDPSSTVTYTLVMTELECNSCTAADEMVVRINANPACTITVDEGASDGVVDPGSTHEAWIADPGAGATIVWVVKDSGGNSLVVSGQGTAAVTFQAPLEPTTIKIAVTVVDANGCGCEFDPPVDVQGPDAAAGILRVLGYIPTVAGWGLMGLAAVVAGAGAWVVRRRKRNE